MRPKVKFVPVWTGAIEGRAVNIIKTFFGQLGPHHEFDDLMQEAFLVYWRCRKAYMGKVDNPKWFMALFQTALRGHLINLRGRRPRYSLLGEDDVPDLAVEDTRSYLLVTLQQLPAEMLQALEIAIAAPKEVLPKRLSSSALRQLQTRITSLIY